MSDVGLGLVGTGAIAVLALLLLIGLLYFIPLRLWIAAWSSGAYVGLVRLVGMRLRRVPPSVVVTARISAVKAGNIGAKLQIDQANADKQVAMAEAFRQGNLGIMDYYRMKNLEADTTMRSAIAGPDEPPAQR